ncbi:hypothetical protein [Streptomyces sp. A5-4]|uniref:hypothetical protein n=1 Tax=Streptomyces sp. A5-4 TaxID=3384771 RepID=UPI003DA9141E
MIFVADPHLEMISGYKNQARATHISTGTTFSSYARDEDQKKSYATAGQCLSTLVYDAGFSQEALHFFASGARLGTKSIVEHLPSDKDKAIWQSPRFTQGLVDCTTNATPTSTPGS